MRVPDKIARANSGRPRELRVRTRRAVRIAHLGWCRQHTSNTLSTMNTKQIILGIVTALFVFGAYFIGLFQGQRHPIKWREYFHSMTAGVTWRGVAWAVTLPACWVLLYYAFIAHVWFSLGRWPKFGERLDSWLVSIHDETIRYFLGALLASLYVAPIILLGCLFVRRWRHVSIYSLCYGVAVGLASCALFLAPHSFLHWFFD